MQKIILLYAVSLLLMHFSNAQDSMRVKHRIYKATVTTESSNSAAKSYLASVSDSSIFISSNGTSFKGYGASNTNYSKIDYNNLAQVRLRRKGSTGRGALKGAIIGLSIGVIAGFISGDDPPCPNDPNDFWGIGRGLCEFGRTTASQKALLGGVAGAFGGGVVGVLVGAFAHKTFIIGGRKEKFDAMKSKLIN